MGRGKVNKINKANKRRDFSDSSLNAADSRRRLSPGFQVFIKVLFTVNAGNEVHGAGGGSAANVHSRVRGWWWW